jgi:hypothetical protein
LPVIVQDGRLPEITQKTMTPPTRLRLVECSAARMDDPNHHLHRRASGYWVMRVTITRDKGLTGSRIKIGMKTHSADKARLRRDRLLAAFVEAGLVTTPGAISDA